MSETIKSVTNCPTCGSEVKVAGDNENTHYYIPVQKKEVDVDAVLNKYLNAILCTKEIPMPKADSNSISESVTKFLNDGNN